MNNTETVSVERGAKVFVFTNHPPLRVAGAEGLSMYDATDGIICDTNPQWGHNWLGYFLTRSGKRVYVSSYNCGESYNGREPKTTRCVERDPMAWLVRHDAEHTHGHLIDPTLIIDLGTR